MRTTSGKLSSTMLKKKLSSQIPSSKQLNPKQKDELNSTNNKDKLSQLKQKLQQQRQNMRKSGRRFKQYNNNITIGLGNQINIQTDDNQYNQDEQSMNINNTNTATTIAKSTTTKLDTKTSTGLKLSKASTSTSTSTSIGSNNLFDFNSIKNKVQQKNKLFIKKPNSNKTNQIVYTATKLLTPSQIINRDQKMVNNNINSNNNVSNINNGNNVNNIQRKKDTINLMQLSTVIQNAESTKIAQKQKSTLLTNSNTTQPKFIQISKLHPSQTATNPKSSILSCSKVFQSAIKQQKKRNKQIYQFLSQIQLQQFTQQFISLGYDEIDILIQVQVDDLNQMMMRAYQQKKLMEFIKKYKQHNQIQQQSIDNNKPLVNKPSKIHSHINYRPKSATLTTQPSQSSQPYTPTSSRLLTDHNLSSSTTILNKSSIFYSIGGSQWSLQSQIRRACSGCFKIFQQSQINKRGECYYCKICDEKELDLDFVMLDQSMIKQFKK